MGRIVSFVVYSKIIRTEVFVTVEVCIHIGVRNNGVDILLMTVVVIGVMLC